MTHDHDITVSTDGVWALFTWNQLVIAWNPCAPKRHRVRCAVVHANGEITVSDVGRTAQRKKYEPAPETKLKRKKAAAAKWRAKQLAKKSCKPQSIAVQP